MRRGGRAAAWALIGVVLAWPAGAQDGGEPILLEGVERLDFERPESWAMAYFGSLMLPTGLGPVRAATRGEVSVELEGGLVPNLGEEKRRVGFIGSKVEDLNRSNVFARLRATVGLPRGAALTVGATPPVEINGVTPELLSAAVALPLARWARWRFGFRLHGQTGSISGDLTCPGAIAASTDPVLNPDDCREPSRDEMSVDSVGLEAAVTRVPGRGRWLPYLGVSVNRFDLAFQVRARYSAFLDRVRLETSGTTFSMTLGAELEASEDIRVAGELFYTPLEVVRDPRRGPRTDELVNARVLVRYRVR